MTSPCRNRDENAPIRPQIRWRARGGWRTLGPTFERFTEKARLAVVRAQEEARSLGRPQIEPEHLLLGLLRVEDGFAATVLAELEITFDGVRGRAERGEAELTGQIPFSREAKKVLELSLREALSIGHNYIGTEHILLALARVRNDNLPDADVLREAVIAKLGRPPARPGARSRLGMAFRNPRWEYRVEARTTLDQDWLNELGAEGWELAAWNGGLLVFKRRREGPAEFRATA